MSDRSASFEPTIGLVDLLDRVLGSGVVAAGDVVLSVANVDLVYLNLRALLASVQTIRTTDGDDVLERLALVPPSTEEAEASTTAGATDHAAPADPGLPGGGWSPDRSGPALRPRRASIEGMERFARRLDRGLGGLPRIDTDPRKVEQGLARLVLTIVDLLRQLMERQAIRRLEAGSLTPEERERLGRTFMQLERRMKELTAEFGLEEDDLGLDLGLDVEDLG